MSAGISIFAYRNLPYPQVSSKRIVYKLPGHQGSVNAVDFHPREPIRELLIEQGTVGWEEDTVGLSYRLLIFSIRESLFVSC